MIAVSPLGSSTLSPSSPLPRVVGWETNERCVSNLSDFFSSSLLSLTPLWPLLPQGQARSSVCWPECYHGQLLSNGSSIRSQPQTHEVANVVGNMYIYSRVCCQILQLLQFSREELCCNFYGISKIMSRKGARSILQHSPLCVMWLIVCMWYL